MSAGHFGKVLKLLGLYRVNSDYIKVEKKQLFEITTSLAAVSRRFDSGAQGRFNLDVMGENLNRKVQELEGRPRSSRRVRSWRRRMRFEPSSRRQRMPARGPIASKKKSQRWNRASTASAIEGYGQRSTAGVRSV